MSSRFRDRPWVRLLPLLVALCAIVALARARIAAADRGRAPLAVTKVERVLRVCADPRNLPFSNDSGDGFEPRLAGILARELDARLEMVWLSQRRAYVRNTLGARRCDVLMGVPATFERVLVTHPYYRSRYVVVSRRDHPFDVHSFDDPRWATVRIGVPLVGDDGASTPPAHALAARGVIERVVGFPVLGDGMHDPPVGALFEALERGDIDVAVAWGPVAGFYARRRSAPIVIARLDSDEDGGIPLAYDIAMAVRPRDRALRDRLDTALTRRRADVEALLDDYGVPR